MQPLEQQHTVQRHVYEFVPYVGLYVFGTGAIILNSLEMCQSIQCAITYHDITAGEMYSNFTTDFEKLAGATDASTALSAFKVLSIFLQVRQISWISGQFVLLQRVCSRTFVFFVAIF